MARLILDTGVLVAAVRGTLDLAEVSGEDDVALPAVVLAEYLAGVEADGDPGRQTVQRGFLDELLTVVPVADYDLAVARHHAELLAHVREVGRPRGPHDLIIAATARATGRTVVATDGKACFGDLPGVGCRVVAVSR